MVAPIFFLLLLAVIEAGRFIFHYEMLSNAARDGVRYAIIHGSAMGASASGPGSGDPTGNAIRQAVSDAAFNVMSVGQLTFPTPTCDGTAAPGLCWSAFPNGGTNERGTTVRLSVSYTYGAVVPVLPPITVSAESSGVINN
jgi:Flp pilus assembly protein TadG